MWQFGTLCLPLAVEVQELEDSDGARLLAEALKDNALKQLSSHSVLVNQSGETGISPMLRIMLSAKEQHNLYGLAISHDKWVIDPLTGQMRLVSAWMSEVTLPRGATEIFQEFERLLDQFLARYTVANTPKTCTKENLERSYTRLKALGSVDQ